MSRLAYAGLAWSAACVAWATWWLIEPGSAPLHVSDDPVSLLGYLGPRAGAALVLAFALVAAVVSARAARDPGNARRPTLAAGAITAAFFGVVAPDIQLLSVLGYSMALLGLPVIVVLLSAGARRHQANLVALVLIGAAIATGVAAGEIGGPTMEMLRQMRDGFAKVGIRPLAVAFLAAGGLVLGAITLAMAPAWAGRSRERLAQWGRVATVVAALGPVPYGLLRLTWATPWPQGLGPGDHSDLDGGIRVFGICLGLAALSGSWLTLGLISRWGRIWPRWVPGLRGRPVPVAAAVVPAGLVATALCAAAVSLAVMAAREGSPGLVLFIPAPVWGPALMLATYAYYRSRTETASDSKADRVESTRAAPAN